MARATTKANGTAENPAVNDPRKRAVKVQAGVLHAALKDVGDAVASKNTIPVLGCVLFEAGDGRITLTATDLDLWAMRSLAANDRDGPGGAEWVKAVRPFACALPAKALAAVVGELDRDAMVTIELPEADGGQRAVIRTGRSRFRLNCLPAEDFPLPPPVSVGCCFELPCSALADSFASVSHAISTEETRYYLNGIYLHPEGLELRMAATDGHRLARLAFDAPDGGASFPPVIVSRQTVALLDRLLVSAMKAADEKAAPPVVLVEAAIETASRLRFELPAADGGEISVIAKAIDGSFPDYVRVIPAAPEHRAVIERAALAAAVKRVAVLGEAKSRAVKAEFTGDLLTLTVTTPELGEAVEELACDYEGPALKIGFDTKYLRDALLALATDQVALGLTDEGAPVLLRGVEGVDGSESERLVQVLMPMRV